MPTVKFPVDHFTKNVRRFYQNYDVALIREFLQNSVDAMAKVISFDIDDNSMTVTDDGIGMDENILVNGLLTMSGSFKGQNSIGGFGAAKEILLFQHLKYEVHTLDNHVVGQNLNYELSKSDTFRGTKIRIWFHDDYKFVKDDFIKKVYTYLTSCDIACKVLVNGAEVDTSCLAGDLVRDLEWAKVYSAKSSEKENWVSVRIRGVEMFKRYISESDFKIVIEVTKPSTDILSASRDNFTYTYDSKLSQVLNEIAIDKSSFGRMFKQTKVYQGSNRYDCLKRVLANLGATLEKNGITDKTEILEKVSARIMSGSSIADAVSDAMSSNVMAAKVSVEDYRSILNVDFYITCEKNIDKIPVQYQPETMGNRKLTIAKLWKRCIKLVLEKNGISVPFATGWIISENHEATHSVVNNVHIFKFNPDLDWLKDGQKAVWTRMLMIAAHEVTHIRQTYHHEDFSTDYERILYKTLMGIDSWWNEYCDSKNEII